MDIKQLKANHNIADVISGYVELRKRGKELIGCCPFHGEKSPSFKVNENKQMFYCFGCGAGGDVVDFITEFHNCDFKRAVEILGGARDENAPTPKPRAPTADPYAGYEIIKPAPAIDGDLWIENPNHETPEPKKWNPTLIHSYRNAAGDITCHVIRAIFGDGKKITPTIHWCRKPNGQEGWVLYHMPEPRIIYNLDLITAYPAAQVVIVEGEKAADFGNKIVNNPERVIFSCWSGGTNAPEKTDFSTLAGRAVVIIPDNDKPGLKAAYDVAKILVNSGAQSIKTVNIPNGLPKGWDIADREWQDARELLTWAKENIGDQYVKPENVVIDLQEPEHIYEPPEHFDNPEVKGVLAKYAVGCQAFPDMPFRILGYRKDKRFYMPIATKQVFDFPPGGHTRQNLMSLAPLDWWLQHFGDGSDVKSIKWDNAVNALLTLSARAGLFNPTETMRGRGAWYDAGRAVLHVGKFVYVDGVITNPEAVDSEFIYELNDSISLQLTEPATTDETVRVADICKQFSWDNPLSGSLLPGWCVVAPVCGVLDWRPHIWLTGPQGSGKSTVLKMIIGKILGRTALQFEGGSTEPGIRSKLGNDARPVLLDEQESEDEASARRLKQILDFARVASSAGRIVKATAGGGGSVQYAARSCFCFSAINPDVRHLADQARASMLVLKKDLSPGAMDRYKKLEIEIAETFTEELSARMLSRTLKNIEVLRKNCATFVDAAAIALGSRRIADQIGPMLAGTYLCHSEKQITLEAAIDWIQKQNWADHTIINSASDFERLISKLSSHRIRVSDGHVLLDITIGEAIVAAAKVDPASEHYSHSVACDHELKRYGIKVDLDGICIANRCEAISKILRDSPWVSNWARVLLENDKAEKTDPVYFMPGLQSRAVRLPVGIFYFK